MCIRDSQLPTPIIDLVRDDPHLHTVITHEIGKVFLEDLQDLATKIHHWPSTYEFLPPALISELTEYATQLALLTSELEYALAHLQDPEVIPKTCDYYEHRVRHLQDYYDLLCWRIFLQPPEGAISVDELPPDMAANS